MIDFLSSDRTTVPVGKARNEKSPAVYMASDRLEIPVGASQRRRPGVVVTPLGISVAVISSTQLRVTFSTAVADNPALTTIANYETSPALTISSITPENGYAGAGPTYVDVVTSEQIDGQAYSFTIYNVEEAS